MVFSILILDLVKQKRFYPYEYISYFKKYKERLSNEEKFYSLLIDKKKLVIKSMRMILRFGIDLEWKKKNERLSWLAHKMWCFIVWKIHKTIIWEHEV